jgi:hypothetical protein
MRSPAIWLKAVSSWPGMVRGPGLPATVRRPSAVELTTAFISQHNQHSDLHRYNAANTAKRYKRPDNRIRLPSQLARLCMDACCRSSAGTPTAGISGDWCGRCDSATHHRGACACQPRAWPSSAPRFTHRLVELPQRVVDLLTATLGDVALLLVEQPVGEGVLA